MLFWYTVFRRQYGYYTATEIRYYLQTDEYTYLFGAYANTNGPTHSDAITEELFDQIVDTFRLVQQPALWVINGLRPEITWPVCLLRFKVLKSLYASKP